MSVKLVLVLTFLDINQRQTTILLGGGGGGEGGGITCTDDTNENEGYISHLK